MKLIATHHKSGTAFLEKVLPPICQNKLKIIRADFDGNFSQSFLADTQYILFTHAKINQIEKLFKLKNPLTILHFIRDPRKLILSAYNYHLRGREKWLNEKYDNKMSHLETLKTLSRTDGIIHEMSTISYWNIIDMIEVEENFQTQTFKIEDISYDKSLNEAQRLGSLLGLNGADLLNAINIIAKNSLWFGENAKLPHVTGGVKQNLEEEWNSELEMNYKRLFGERDKILNYEFKESKKL